MVKIKFTNSGPQRLEKYSKEGHYYDERSLDVLERMKLRQTKNFDNVGIFVGDVGVGKTTMALSWLNYMLNGKINIDNVGVGAEDSLEKIPKQKDCGGSIIDDASTLFMGSDHNSKFQKKGIKILHLCRSKRQSVFLTTPDIFKINSYVVTQRARFVIRCYTDKKLNRGFFAFWGYKKLPALYRNGKKNNNSFAAFPKPDFIGRFTNYIPPFNDEYEKLKRKAMLDLTNDKEREYSIKDLKPIYLNLLKKIPLMKKKITYRQFADLTGLSGSTITNYKQEIVPKTPKNSQI